MVNISCPEKLQKIIYKTVKDGMALVATTPNLKKEQTELCGYAMQTWFAKFLNNFDGVEACTCAFSWNKSKRELLFCDENSPGAPPKLSTIVKSAMARGQRIFTFPLEIDGHANVIIVDTVKKEIHRFDPNGLEISGLGLKTTNLDSAIQGFFKGMLDPDWYTYEYTGLGQLMKNIGREKNGFFEFFGPQRIEGQLSSQSKIDIKGYCATWSMFYTFLIVNEPDEFSPERFLACMHNLSPGELRSIVRLWNYRVSKELLKLDGEPGPFGMC